MLNIKKRYQSYISEWRCRIGHLILKVINVVQAGEINLKFGIILCLCICMCRCEYICIYIYLNIPKIDRQICYLHPLSWLQIEKGFSNLTLEHSILQVLERLKRRTKEKAIPEKEWPMRQEGNQGRVVSTCQVKNRCQNRVINCVKCCR